MSSPSSSPPRENFQRVSLKEIEDATENFDERFVQGHWGEAKVYSAQIMLGRSEITQVTIKHLKPNSSGFEDEIQIMPKIQHPNIVSLLGYCDDSGQKLLIYEYMANGSLADYVQKKQNPTSADSTTISLSWEQRLKICLGAALGLKHLHAERKEFPKGIIHRDVKPHNILLNANWVAKISDLSCAYQIDSAMPTMVKGTCGYYAPEYVEYQHLTRKIDVYAFGVVLFQVLCRKMPWDRGDDDYYGMEDEDLGEWARQNVDSIIREEISDYSLKEFTEVIRKSLSVKPKKRPTMDEVVLTLQTALKHQLCEDLNEVVLTLPNSLEHQLHGDVNEVVMTLPNALEHQLRGDLNEVVSTLPNVLEHQLRRDIEGAADAGGVSPARKCEHVSLTDIEKATDNFDQRYFLGEGGESKVYLAKIMLGGSEITQVAVKQLKPMATVFEDEVQIMSKIQHPNIVSLLGYCNDSGQRILIYEYMVNGSLANYIRKQQKPSATSTTIPLSWEQRLKISLGAASGLKHLHAETKEFAKGIIHRDVKPHNILLDANWVAKISDFGMLKQSGADQIESAMLTNRKGTRGYYAPEYLKSQRVTTKVDVFAFGVVLFEVLCRKLPWDREDESYYSTEDEDLGEWARQNVDPEIREEISDYCLKAFTEVIRKTLSSNPKNRPTMDEVALTLQWTLQDALENHLEAAIDADGRSPARKCEHVSLKEIIEATENFDERYFLGKGGESKVYLAKIMLGGSEISQVAVKQLNNTDSSGFEDEIRIMSKIQHPNIVSLLGYCNDSGQKILIYEYMVNGSLANYIRKQQKPSATGTTISLSWVQRLRICHGAALGLKRLHANTKEFSKGIVHRDVKPLNILLDANWEAKISDFGMFKQSRSNQIDSELFTNIKGTGAYFAPEYLRSLRITRGIDVYAFGVVLYQVLCRRLPWDKDESSFCEEDYNNLGYWARENVDSVIRGEISDYCLNAFIEIIVKSLSQNPKERPTMVQVVLTLQHALERQRLEAATIGA